MLKFHIYQFLKFSADKVITALSAVFLGLRSLFLFKNPWSKEDKRKSSAKVNSAHVDSANIGTTLHKLDNSKYSDESVQEENEEYFDALSPEEYALQVEKIRVVDNGVLSEYTEFQDKKYENYKHYDLQHGLQGKTQLNLSGKTFALAVEIHDIIDISSNLNFNSLKLHDITKNIGENCGYYTFTFCDDNGNLIKFQAQRFNLYFPSYFKNHKNCSSVELFSSETRSNKYKTLDHLRNEIILIMQVPKEVNLSSPWSMWSNPIMCAFFAVMNSTSYPGSLSVKPRPMEFNLGKDCVDLSYSTVDHSVCLKLKESAVDMIAGEASKSGAFKSSVMGDIIGSSVSFVRKSIIKNVLGGKDVTYWKISDILAIGSFINVLNEKTISCADSVNTKLQLESTCVENAVYPFGNAK